MARAAFPRSVAAEFALAALVGAAALPLTRLFRAGNFGLVAVGSVVGSLAVAWVLRRIGVPPILSWVWSALAFLWFASAALATDTLAGPFPTAESLRALGRMADEAVRQAVERSAPVPAAGPVLLAAATGIWVTSLLAHTALFGARNPLLAIASTLPLFATAGSIVPSRRLVAEALFWLTAAALVLHLAQRRQAKAKGWRPGAVARVAVPAIVVALVAGPMLPGVGAPPGLKERGPGARIAFNPLVAIRPTLDLTPTQRLFTVRTERPTYVRLTALDRFDGGEWREAPRRLIPLRRLPPPPAEVELVEQRIRIDRLAGDWVPAAYQAVATTAPDVSADSRSGALIIPTQLPHDLEYSVTSAVPTLDREVLTVEGIDDIPVPREMTTLPPVPRVVEETAREITAGATTRFDKAVALQDHLRGFTYDINVAAGHSYDSIEGFLNAKRGYCEQFAGTMAVLARSLGIPARVAIGFGIGTIVAPDTYELTTNEAHAWVEVWFPNAGWVAFEPTPRGGVTRTPSYANPQLPIPGNEVPEPADPGDTTDPDARAPSAPDADEPGSGEPKFSGGVPLVPTMLGIGAATLVVVVVPLVVAFARRRRIARIREPVRAVRSRYVDFLEWCEAAGLGRRPGETPMEHAERLAGAFEEAREPLIRAAAVAGTALWARPNGIEPGVAAGSFSAARAALARSLPRSRRVIAASGWGRWRTAH